MINNRLLRLNLLILAGAWAGWTQTITFPATGTTTAADQVRITITIPANVTRLRVEVFGSDNTPVYDTVVRNLTPGSITKKVPLALGAGNKIAVSDVAIPANRSEITITQSGNPSDERGNWEASGYVGASI